MYLSFGKPSSFKNLFNIIHPEIDLLEDYNNKAHLNYARNKTAIVFQQYNLFQNMNVLKIQLQEQNILAMLLLIH